MKIDFEKYDETSKMEIVIEGIIKMFGLTHAYIKLSNEKDQLIYALTILSILYKERCYEEYLAQNINGKIDEESIAILDEIIEELKTNIQEKDLDEVTCTIKNYGELIKIYLERYFMKKRTNYITKKHSIEIITSQNNQKQLLSYNPFAINQLLEYEQKPLTREEIIIEDIIELLMESELHCKTKEQILKKLKQLMKQKYKKEELDEVISFIISDTYQEVIDNPLDENRNIVIPILENSDIKKEYIIKHFNEDDNFSSMILKTFISYNYNIQEGRLEELEQKPSKEIAEKMYKKKP